MRTFVAPGRTNLIGEHTDYTDGLVLPAAIDRGITLKAAFGGNRIRLTSDQTKTAVDISADGDPMPGEGWGRFVAAVASELGKAGRPPIGLEGGLTSTLPVGAGLSSSAALEVVVALALCAAADFKVEPMDLAALCRRAEHSAVGVPSGIMDQAASLLGRRHHAVLLDCGSLEHRHVPLPTTHVLLVIDSGVRRELETAGYGRRVEELQEALAAVGRERPSQIKTNELERYCQQLDPVLARRLRHVVTENDRVRATRSALANGDLTQVGRLFSESHNSLRDDFEVSTEELDLLVEKGLEAGATAARMTGAGFGGSVIMLARSEHANEIAQNVIHQYRARFPSLRPTAFICDAAEGAREIRHDGLPPS